MLNTESNNIFQTINIYGIPFQLRYRKSEKYSTIIGLILSLLTFMMVILIAIMYSLDLIKHTGFNIMLNYNPIKIKTPIDFSKIPFMIGFVNWSRSNQILNSSYLSLTFDRNVHNVYKDKEGIIKIERISNPIKLENCNPNIHFIGKNYFMNDFQYDKFLCPIQGQNLNFSGRFGDNIIGYDILEIHLNKCENNSDNLFICKSNDEIDEYIKNSYLEIIYLAQSIEHNNYKNPIVNYVRNEIYVLTKKITKRYYHYFSLAEYISDNGLFFESKKHYSFSESDNTRLDFVEEEDQEYYSSNALLEVAFTCSDRKNVYTRTYVKIQDVMKNIGGFIDLIFIVFQFISSYFSKKIMLLDIINHIIVEEKFEKTINGIINCNRIMNNNNNNNNKNNTVYKNSEFNILNVSNINDIILPKSQVLSSNLKNNFLEKKKNKENNDNKKNQKEYFHLNFFDFFLPIKILWKFKKYNWLYFYKQMVNQYMSLEVIIPIIERLTKINLETKRKSNFFKLN